ncbi:MAG: hypothetical protein N2V75_05035 [Methanophagales archaeon]|nr:hypothetical protein [Methanophagales archaeon]
MSKRPTGVTILAIWYLIEGVISIVGSIIYLSLITTSPLSYMYINSGISWWLTFGVVVSFISAIVYFITGWGLWRLRPWARIVALILAVIGILSIYGIPISVIIIWYLLKSEVKAAFQPTPSPTPTADKTLDIYPPIDTLKQKDTVTPIYNVEEVGKYAECPYCGSNIRETFYELGSVVRCNKCGALHHKECFEYYGRKCGSPSCKLKEA